MKKTKAEELGIANFPYEEYDNGYLTYYEYDKHGNTNYSEYSNGVWYRSKYGDNDVEIYWENNNGKKMYGIK